ncbi:MAG: exodeoxyribonuclease V subunit gamma, partial [Thermoanaerobaculia bacterium]|nr:exodeoxyribonuclease V subunit gamma [Thermoanaerobaculia bacterium]
MIRLVYSNQTESLLDALVESLREHRSNPLDSLDVVVPNQHLEAYLRIGIAKRVGIATGVRFCRLEEAIEDSLVSPEKGPSAALVDHWELFGAVLGTLIGKTADEDPDLAPVRSYLDSVDDPAGRDLRSVQLAQRVTHLYEEYILHRPEMLREWRRGIKSGGGSTIPQGSGRDVHASDESDETYRWQASLFRHAIQGLQRDEDPLRLCLDDLVQESHQRRLRRHAPLFVFGLSYVAPLYQRLFAHLAEHCSLHLFTLNPCCEFWEDIETDREIRRRLAPSHRDLRVGAEILAHTEDPFGFLEDDDNRALRRWGIPGRESMRLLNEVSDCDFEPRFEVPEGTGVLPCLQRDILFRQPQSATAATTGEEAEVGVGTDETLRFVAVSDPRREAQVVVDEIWRSLRHDEAQRADIPEV